MNNAVNERYRFIEQVVGWEGEINATHLSKKFSLTRQAASEILKQYRKHAPHYLQYNSSSKAFLPTQAFNDYFSQSDYLCQFYNYLNTVLNKKSDLWIVDTGFCYEVEAPLRNINPIQVRPILKAIREKLAIDIGYISLSSPNYLDRIIQPHALIFDGLRWHVRAYCNKNQAFRDFTLSRFKGEAISEGKATVFREDDQAWNTFVDVIIEADPRFTKEQKTIIEQDFQMKNGTKIIKSRAALVNYLLRRLRIDSFKNSPEQQQIVLTQACLKNITQYLPMSF
ncbi:MAG: WYL domain-containing protein [Colwellia sp.]